MPATYLVARMASTVFIRAVGMANMKNAPMLEAFLQEEINRSTQTACVDLSDCTGMDSTFMGVMVGSAQTLAKAGGRLVIVNPSQNNLRLLDMLGVCAILPVLPKCSVDPAMEYVSLPASPSLSPIQRAEIIKRAHQTLSSLNECNQAKFSAFLVALEADLAKLHGSQPT